METIFEWLKNNSSSATSITTAIISASVAIVVLVAGQWLLSRRSRKEFLTSKLEELYILLNDIGECNVER